MPQIVIYAAIYGAVCLGPFLVVAILAGWRDSDRLREMALELGIAGIVVLLILAALNAGSGGHGP